MEINNISLFFVGIVMSILGTFVMIYDYPQIQYFENTEYESDLMLEGQNRDIHQRLKIEFAVGGGILVSGIIILIISIFKTSKTNVKN